MPALCLLTTACTQKKPQVLPGAFDISLMIENVAQVGGPNECPENVCVVGSKQR